MKIDRLALGLVITFALSAAACASDPNRNVKSAEANLTSEQQKANAEEARLNERQAQEQVAAQQQQQQQSADKRVELQSKQLEERAEATADTTKNLADADKDLATAHAEMQKERTATEADARARVTKADAKAWEARNKSAKVPANKRAKFNVNVNAYNTKKAEVQTLLSTMTRASDNEWNNAKVLLEKNLDELDGFARRLDEDM
jgi:membrane protein involved in colicin uptake